MNHGSRSLRAVALPRVDHPRAVPLLVGVRAGAGKLR
jgi:hypothetical protein